MGQKLSILIVEFKLEGGEEKNLVGIPFPLTYLYLGWNFSQESCFVKFGVQ